MGIPNYQYMEGTASSSGYRKRFAELARELPVAVHDTLDDLRAARAKGKGKANLRILGDGHYSAEGHKVLAESLAPAVERLLPPVAATTERSA